MSFRGTARHVFESAFDRSKNDGKYEQWNAASIKSVAHIRTRSDFGAPVRRQRPTRSAHRNSLDEEDDGLTAAQRIRKQQQMRFREKIEARDRERAERMAAVQAQTQRLVNAKFASARRRPPAASHDLSRHRGHSFDKHDDYHEGEPQGWIEGGGGRIGDSSSYPNEHLSRARKLPGSRPKGAARVDQEVRTRHSERMETSSREARNRAGVTSRSRHRNALNSRAHHGVPRPTTRRTRVEPSSSPTQSTPRRPVGARGRKTAAAAPPRPGNQSQGTRARVARVETGEVPWSSSAPRGTGNRRSRPLRGATDTVDKMCDDGVVQSQNAAGRKTAGSRFRSAPRRGKLWDDGGSASPNNEPQHVLSDDLFDEEDNQEHYDDFHDGVDMHRGTTYVADENFSDDNDDRDHHSGSSIAEASAGIVGDVPIKAPPKSEPFTSDSDHSTTVNRSVGRGESSAMPLTSKAVLEATSRVAQSINPEANSDGDNKEGWDADKDRHVQEQSQKEENEYATSKENYLPHGHDEGDKVMVLWDSSWKEAMVIDGDASTAVEREGLCAIHYVGFNDSKDDMVPWERIIVDQDTHKAFVRYRGGKKCEVKVSQPGPERLASVFKAAFDGFDDTWDRWVMHRSCWRYLDGQEPPSSALHMAAGSVQDDKPTNVATYVGMAANEQRKAEMVHQSATSKWVVEDVCSEKETESAPEIVKANMKDDAAAISIGGNGSGPKTVVDDADDDAGTRSPEGKQTPVAKRNLHDDHQRPPSGDMGRAAGEQASSAIKTIVEEAANGNVANEERRRWSTEEEEALMAGIRKYGQVRDTLQADAKGKRLLVKKRLGEVSAKVLELMQRQDSLGQTNQAEPEKKANTRLPPDDRGVQDGDRMADVDISWVRPTKSAPLKHRNSRQWKSQQTGMASKRSNDDGVGVVWTKTSPVSDRRLPPAFKRGMSKKLEPARPSVPMESSSSAMSTPSGSTIAATWEEQLEIVPEERPSAFRRGLSKHFKPSTHSRTTISTQPDVPEEDENNEEDNASSKESVSPPPMLSRRSTGRSGRIISEAQQKRRIGRTGARHGAGDDDVSATMRLTRGKSGRLRLAGVSRTTHPSGRNGDDASDLMPSTLWQKPVREVSASVSAPVTFKRGLSKHMRSSRKPEASITDGEVQWQDASVTSAASPDAERVSQVSAFKRGMSKTLVQQEHTNKKGLKWARPRNDGNGRDISAATQKVAPTDDVEWQTPRDLESSSTSAPAFRRGLSKHLKPAVKRVSSSQSGATAPDTWSDVNVTGNDSQATSVFRRGLSKHLEPSIQTTNTVQCDSQDVMWEDAQDVSKARSVYGRGISRQLNDAIGEPDETKDEFGIVNWGNADSLVQSQFQRGVSTASFDQLDESDVTHGDDENDTLQKAPTLDDLEWHALSASANVNDGTLVHEIHAEDVHRGGETKRDVLDDDEDAGRRQSSRGMGNQHGNDLSPGTQPPSLSHSDSLDVDAMLMRSIARHTTRRHNAPFSTTKSQAALGAKQSVGKFKKPSSGHEESFQAAGTGGAGKGDAASAQAKLAERMRRLANMTNSV